MLSALQRQLSDIYQAGTSHDVRDYLVTDPTVARCIGQDAMLADSRETLLMAEDEEGLALSLFLDSELIERLETADPLTRLRAHQLEDLWLVLEGLSHFNCVVWRAARDRSVSLLELELQAEVDKFVATALLAIAQGRQNLMKRLHGWLFDEVRFRDDLDDEQVERYRAANDYAARFCHSLRERLLCNDDGVLHELRHFYRLPMTDKVSHIHTRALSAG